MQNIARACCGCIATLIAALLVAASGAWAQVAPQAAKPAAEADLVWVPLWDVGDAGRQPVAPATDAYSLSKGQRLNGGPRADAPLTSEGSPGLIINRDALGVQLDGGARVTIQRSDGGQKLYYRNRF